jgi:aryl-alcohol dehydrogenase-like predicted oxidoreductase
MINSKEQIQLGTGLIGIGRTWGHKETPIPSQEEALDYLRTAYKSGIHFFDTAPSYGTSEKRLGKFIESLSSDARSKIVVATKFGEHWNDRNSAAYSDHSFTALRESIDQSLQRLKSIDLLQVHKTSPKVLQSEDLNQAIEYAKKKGISNFGASVSDLESAQIVCEDDRFNAIQLPFNSENLLFEDVIKDALNRGKLVVLNRPFNMGGILYASRMGEDEQKIRSEAYQFITERVPMGVILTGTKSPEHLLENIAAFSLALGHLEN